MSGVTAYTNMPGVGIDVQTSEDLIEALDAIHTQAVDVGMPPPFIRILERAREEVWYLAETEKETKEA